MRESPVASLAEVTPMRFLSMDSARFTANGAGDKPGHRTSSG